MTLCYYFVLYFNGGVMATADVDFDLDRPAKNYAFRTLFLATIFVEVPDTQNTKSHPHQRHPPDPQPVLQLMASKKEP